MPVAHMVPFILESLRIELMSRAAPYEHEIQATEKFLTLRTITVDDLVALAQAYEPKAIIRASKGMDVRVGDYKPPPGGAAVPRGLKMIIAAANKNLDPCRVHLDFETLHPFVDGNGRAGRALWAWQMLRLKGPDALVLGFLHPWYYQSIAFYD